MESEQSQLTPKKRPDTYDLEVELKAMLEWELEAHLNKAQADRRLVIRRIVITVAKVWFPFSNKIYFSQLMPVYFDKFVDFDPKPDSPEKTWSLVKQRIQTINQALKQQLNHEIGSFSDLQLDFDNPHEQQSDLESLTNIYDTAQDLSIALLTSDDERDFNGELHKVCALVLLIAIQSPQSEKYIEHITNLNQTHQETIMRILERMGISNTGSPLEQSPQPVSTMIFSNDNQENSRLLSCSPKRRQDSFIIEKLQNMESEKEQLEEQNQALKSKHVQSTAVIEQLSLQLDNLNLENEKLRDQIIQYELMETQMKACQQELKVVQQESDRMAQDFKAELASKQEEIDLLAEKLMKKEGIETKLEDYKSRFQQYKDMIEQKNLSLLQAKDQDQTISELKTSLEQSQKVQALFKEQLTKEQESRIQKDIQIKKLELESERLREEVDRLTKQAQKKDDTLRQQSLELNLLKQSMEFVQENQIFETKDSSLDSLLSDMKERLIMLQAENTQLRQKEEQEQHLQESKTQVKQLVLEKEALVEAQMQLQKKVKSSEDKLEDLRHQVLQLRERLSGFQEKDKASQDKIFQLQKEKVQQSQKDQKIEKEMTELKERLESQQAQIRVQEGEKNKLEYQIQQLQEQIKELKQQLNDKECDVRRQSIEYIDLKHRFEQLSKDYQKLADLSQQTKQKYQEAKRANQEHQVYREKQAIEYTDLLKTCKDRELEIEQARQIQEKLEQSVKEAISEKLKSIMQKNREKEEIQRQLESYKKIVNDSELEVESEQVKQNDTFKMLGLELLKLKESMNKEYDNVQTPQPNPLSRSKGSVVPSMIKHLKGRIGMKQYNSGNSAGTKVGSNFEQGTPITNDKSQTLLSAYSFNEGQDSTPKITFNENI